MNVLVLNCGSSSIKYKLYHMAGGGGGELVASGFVERIGEEHSAFELTSGGKTTRRDEPIADHEAGLAMVMRALGEPGVGVLERLDEIKAVGHRVVHGKDRFTGSVLVDEAVIKAIEDCADLAPLHNPANLAGIRAAMHVLPGAAQVACFDTAYHTTMPRVAYTYALPHELCESMGIRRYGFHGVSHRYVARRAAQMLGLHKYEINCISCHLGNGCSAAAIRGGRSVDTSMGLTPLEGLVMGTRTGDLDPAVLLYLAERGYDPASFQTLVNRESGLLGISGVSNDMRTLIDHAKAGHELAQLAIDLFCYRIRKYIGAYMAVLGRCDAVIFTGGIGASAPLVRAESCSGLEPLGIELDAALNEQTIGGEGVLSTGRVKVLAIPTDEERAIAADTYQIATGGSNQ
jgi:acetate kinase